MLDLFYLFGNSVLEKLPALHVTLELELKGEKGMRCLEMLLRQLHGNFCIYIYIEEALVFVAVYKIGSFLHT